ncbi:MAG: hypothetical protein ABL940_10790, partial [Bacteroidia bacterium]
MKTTLLTTLLAFYTLTALAGGTNWTITPFERKAFIENKEQFKATLPAQYQNFEYCIDNGVQVLFTKEGLTHVITKRNPKKAGFGALFMSEEKREELAREIDVHTQYITMKWIGANTNVTIENSALQTTNYNYFIRPKVGAAYTENCKGYSKITYKNLYNGIDVEYIFTAKEGFKYNIIASAGADVSQVKMQYNNDVKLLINEGNVIIKTIKGNITDHAPITYLTSNTSEILPSTFSIQNNIVSFNVNNANKQAITIDPWTVVPSAASPAYDNGIDGTGNVYLYGLNHAVEKYTATGTSPTWSLNIGPTSYYGDMLVESNGNFYLSEGFDPGGAHTYKFSPTGAPIWTSTTPGSGFREHWRISINCITNQVIVAGGGTSTPTDNIAEIDINTGTLTNIKKMFSGGAHDISGLCVDEGGKSYLHDANSNQLVFTNNTNTAIGFAASGYGMGEITNPITGSNGYNMMTLGGTNFLFTSDGATLKKWDRTTYAMLASVAIPGGSANSSGGILADKCNNLFVGSNAGVYRFDFNLVQKEFQPTTSAVYDIAYAPNSDIVACGAGFATSLPFGRESCGSLKIFVTSNPCNPAINTVKVRPLLGIPPFTFLWEDGNTDSIRVNLSAGIHIVTIKDASCIPQFIKDTVRFKVEKPIFVTQLKPCFNTASGQLSVGLSQVQKIVSYTITPTVASTQINDSTVLATGLADGTYAFHFVSDIGCSFDTTIKLTQYTAITSTTTALRRAVCPGQFTGVAKVSAQGSAPYTTFATAPYTYSWNTSPIQTDSIITSVKEGTYTVTITDSIGCTKLDSVIIIANPNPVAAFSTDSVCFNTATTFTDATTLASGSIKNWTWIFGGTAIVPVPTSTLQNPTFVYDKCNNAPNNATLIVTSDSGCVSTLTQAVTVHCLPVPNFTFNNGCEKDDRIQFTNTSTNGAGTTGALISKWRLGLSPLPIVALSPSQVYNAPGNYSINLIATDKYGCTETVTKPLVIYPKPTANFTVDSVCLNVANTFTNTTTLNVPAGFNDVLSAYNWTYNYTNNYTTDATTASSSHIYTLPATQAIPTVALIVKTNNNCADT